MGTHSGCDGRLRSSAVFKALNERCRSVLDVNQFSRASRPRARWCRSRRWPFRRETPQAFRELVELSEAFRTIVFCDTDGEAAHPGALEDIDAADRVEIEIARLVVLLGRDHATGLRASGTNASSIRHPASRSPCGGRAGSRGVRPVRTRRLRGAS